MRFSKGAKYAAISVPPGSLSRTASRGRHGTRPDLRIFAFALAALFYTAPFRSVKNCKMSDTGEEIVQMTADHGSSEPRPASA